MQPYSCPAELRQNEITSPIVLERLEIASVNFIHWHDHAELLFVLDGLQCMEINGRLYELHAGDFMWISSRVIHNVNPGFGRESRFYSMLYDQDYMFGQPRGIAKEKKEVSRYLRPFLDRHRLIDPCILRAPHTGEIGARLDRMYAAYRMPDSLKRDCILRGELLNILSEIADSLEASSLFSKPQPAAGFPIEAVCRYIDDNSGNLKLEDAAAHLGYSKNSFACRFREALGYTFREYTTYVRMMEAARMLSEGVSIAETAYRLGYNNVCNFSRAHSKYAGVPPSSITYIPLKNR